MKVKDVDKTLVASVALHVLVLGWAMVSVSTKALEVPPEDSVPVDVVSSDQLAKVMAGMKTGKKDNPKPLAEKVAEAKPVDDAVGKITEKPPVVTETAPPPQPKVEEKPVEKKPDPPKVVERSRRKSRSRSRRSPTRQRLPRTARPRRSRIRSSPTRSPKRSRRKRRSRRRSRYRRPSRRSRRSRRSSNDTSIRRRSRRCSTSATRRARPRPAIR